jgi:hypothetical protein
VSSRALTRLGVGGLAWLALFSLVFTVGSSLGVWPIPEGGFAGTDLAAGLAFALALLGSLLARPRR